MIETLDAQVLAQGPWLLFAITFLACLAVPIPASLVMLAAGGFAATGRMDSVEVATAALAGSVLGDQMGFGIGRAGGVPLWDRLLASPRGGPLAARAGLRLRERSFAAVFLSRWLFSPLGPWINFAAGATRIGWGRFSVAAVIGKAIWVAIYVGLGHLFAAQAEAMGPRIAGVIVGLAASVAVALVLRAWWRR